MGEIIFFWVILNVSFGNYISYRIKEFSYRNVIQTGSFPKIITFLLPDFKMGVLFKSYWN